jgi:hypothetical protein
MLDSIKAIISEGPDYFAYSLWCDFRVIQVCSFISSLDTYTRRGTPKRKHTKTDFVPEPTSKKGMKFCLPNTDSMALSLVLVDYWDQSTGHKYVILAFLFIWKNIGRVWKSAVHILPTTEYSNLKKKIYRVLYMISYILPTKNIYNNNDIY